MSTHKRKSSYTAPRLHLTSPRPFAQAFVGVTLLGALSVSGCGEEVTPHNPTFIASQASMLCTPMGGQSYLKSLSFVAEDLDGAETLRAPSVELSTLALPMSAELIPAPTSEERAQLAESSDATILKCEHESCRVRYTWSFSASEARRVSCGADGKGLTAQLAISDENGYRAIASLPSKFE